MVDRIGRVKLTNPDKVLYPATGTTKAEVFDYYVTIAEAMIPHIAGRPVTRKRWPNGVEEPSFFEKQLASSAPDWLDRESVTHRSGTTTYPIIDNVDGLAWIAQQAALEVHVPQWRFVDSWSREKGAEKIPGPATRIVFDLDPGDDVTFRQLCEVAHEVRDFITDIGLTTYPLTSGSKGLHLYVPLAEPVSSRGASVLAKRIAQQLEKTMPKQVTATMTKSLRAGKVFLDWSQNSSAKTTIAPYSMRGREEPTVAAPRTWEEIEDPDLRHLRFDEVLERVERDGDLLAGLDEPVPESDKLTTYRSMRDAAKTLSRFRRRRPRPATTTPSSSRSTMPAACTTTSGWNATACWCRGRCRRTCRTPPRSTTSLCTPRTIRSNTGHSKGRFPRASTAAARSSSGTPAPTRPRSSTTTAPTGRPREAR